MMIICFYFTFERFRTLTCLFHLITAESCSPTMNKQGQFIFFKEACFVAKSTLPPHDIIGEILFDSSPSAAIKDATAPKSSKKSYS